MNERIDASVRLRSHRAGRVLGRARIAEVARVRLHGRVRGAQLLRARVELRAIAAEELQCAALVGECTGEEVADLAGAPHATEDNDFALEGETVAPPFEFPSPAPSIHLENGSTR